MRAEPIDCVVIKRDRLGSVRHSEGAQSVFGQTRAEKIVKKLGKGWEVILLAQFQQEFP